VDFKKAFDSINREMMYSILHLYGIPTQLVAAIRKLYDNSKAMVSVNGKTSDLFEITTGVLQGDTLAPFLFIIVMDYVMSNSEEDHGFIYKLHKSSRHPEQKINDLDFADDIAMLENSIRLANEQIRKLATTASEVGLEINAEKTEYMAFNIPEAEDGDVLLGNHKLKRVNDFRYLGSLMQSTEADFERRKGLAYGAWTSMAKIWKATHVPLKLKVNIFDASVVSILLYGCESWIVTPKIEQKINVVATNCYRNMLNIKRSDHVKLADIYERVKRKPLINTVRKRQLGWLGHTMRLQNDEPTKVFAMYEPEIQHGKAKRGAKKLSYKTQITQMLTGQSD
jgi:Reverse transcriptase (RNA-dependent DNA polymerase)